MILHSLQLVLHILSSSGRAVCFPPAHTHTNTHTLCQAALSTTHRCYLHWLHENCKTSRVDREHPEYCHT